MTEAVVAINPDPDGRCTLVQIAECRDALIRRGFYVDLELYPWPDETARARGIVLMVPASTVVEAQRIALSLVADELGTITGFAVRPQVVGITMTGGAADA